MSDEEKFNEIIQEINQIFLFLTKEEPTPDDEIEAREKLTDRIKTLMTLDVNQVESNIFHLESTLSELENWDTLELWFIESSLPELIQKIIDLSEITPDVQLAEETKEPEIDEPEPEPVPEQEKIDINEIVNKVSEQFKGEIDGLKHKIDSLEHELEKKEESITRAPSKKVVKIKPRKNVRLPPPKIKIPVIKVHDTPPQIKIPVKSEAEKPKIKVGMQSISQVQAKIEEELHKLKSTPILEEESELKEDKVKDSEEISRIRDTDARTLPPPPEPDFKPEIKEEPESILDILEGSAILTPTPGKVFKIEPPRKSESTEEISKVLDDIPPAPKPNFKIEISQEPDLISDILDEIGPLLTPPGSEYLTDIPEGPDIDIINELEIVPPPPKSSFMSEIPKELPKLDMPAPTMPGLPKDLPQLDMPAPVMPEELKKSNIISEVSFTEENSSKKKEVVPFFPKNPKITSVSVEEIEEEPVKSSGRELFNVFSSVGEETTTKPRKNLELFTSIPTKEKKKKEDKKKKKGNNSEELKGGTMTFVETKSNSTTEEELKPFSIEELPSDKDSLYQELIALEGKRYSLEKTNKEIEKTFNAGSINDSEFKNQTIETRSQMDEITSRINKIRRVISSL